MSNLIIDLANYRDRFGAYVEPGRYRVQIEEMEPGTTAKNDPKITGYYRIIGGESDGKTLVDTLTLTDKAMFRMVALMDAVGLPTPRKKLSVPAGKFVGQVLEVEVTDGEPFGGSVRSNIAQYFKVKKTAPQKIAAEEPIEDDEIFEDEAVEGTPLDSSTPPWDSGESSSIDDDLLEELEEF